MQAKIYKVFNVKDLSLNQSNATGEDDFSIRLFHLPEDPPNANRIRVAGKEVEVELLPSKGLSVGQAWIKGSPVFWDAPIELPDTEKIDLWSDELLINGAPAPGFTFLKTLVGGVELYGLNNWGMPVDKEGKLQPLHGETSNIPVDTVQLSIVDQICTLQATFIYRTFEGDADVPWYERGESLFRVTKKIILTKNRLEIRLEDVIENISNKEQIPDWGYHITFRPEEGARYIVPSKLVEERSGNELIADYQTWQKAANEKIRTETGIIHKNIETTEACTVESRLIYPDKRTLLVTTTPAPYFQTWFCNGGKGSDEFTFKNGESLLRKNWDGMGIEIGSSALDHNGNIDKSVDYQPELKPGQSKTIRITVQQVGS